jgi:limonene-1,2-epoxide hydrolase
MTTNIQQIAEAFSSHRFTEAAPHLAANVRWIAVGQSTLEGRDAVVKACEDTAAELAAVKTEFTRFLSVAGTDAVAVDAIARYHEAGGTVSMVSSCDIYEFEDSKITTITSYAVELPQP